MNLLFFVAALIAIFATIMVVTRHNAVHALLYLVLSLLSLAVIFYTSGAPYAAALEIIVYAGAIMILFVFVVMMLNLSHSSEEEKASTKIKAWIVPAILSTVLFIEFIYAFNIQQNLAQPIEIISIKKVAISLFTSYLLGVELVGVLLLAGIVGAYHLGRTKKKNLHRYLETKE